MESKSNEVDTNRRRLLGTVAMTVAVAQLGIPAVAATAPRIAKDEHSADKSKAGETGVNIVLVHGAWADGSGWARVIRPLQSKGLKTTAAPIPLTSLSDDVAALDSALERTTGPIVLVGHAYSGAVVGACHNERVRALVFVSALTPDQGETVAEVFYRDKPNPHAPKLAPDKHGLLWIPTEQFGPAWCQNASAQEAALLAAVQRPIAVACIQEKASQPGWKAKPSWYLVAEEDRMINPATQLFLAQRMGAQIRSEKVDHASLITAPDLVVGAILQAVASLSASPNSEKSNKQPRG
jgi:pimeloyl-ACP methyl ester carboxylesterase